MTIRSATVAACMLTLAANPASSQQPAAEPARTHRAQGLAEDRGMGPLRRQDPARAPDQAGRRRRGAYAHHQQPRRGSNAGVAAGRGRAGAARHPRRGDRQGPGRAHPDRADLRRGGRAGRHAGGADRGRQAGDPLCLQRLRAPQRGHPRGLPALEDADHPARQGEDGREVRRGDRSPAAPVLREHGGGTAARLGPGEQRPAGDPRRQSRQQGPRRGHHAPDPGPRAGRPLPGRRRPRGPGRRRGGHHGPGDFAGRHAAVLRPQGRDT